MCHLASHVSGSLYINQPVAEQVNDYISLKKTHERKFSSFLAPNHDCPYQDKHKAWQSALKAAIFYSCETWFTKDTRAAEVAYYINTEPASEC
jgi:hypothetical protein